MTNSSTYDLFLDACKQGDYPLVEKLLPDVNPKQNKSEALRWAAGNGHADIVKLLLPLSQPKDHESGALRWAAENGRADIVEVLIPVSNPKDRESEALRWAAQYGYGEIVELLWDFSDPERVLSTMKKEEGLPKESMVLIEQRLLVDQTKKKLTEELQKVSNQKKLKTKLKM